MRQVKPDGTVVDTHAPAAFGNSAAQAVLASGFTLSSSSGTYQDTGLSVTLPAAGTYVVTADVRGTGQFSGAAPLYLVAKLHNSTDGADVANSEMMIFYTEGTSLTQRTASINVVVTVAASKVIKLYCARFYSGTPSNTSVASDAAGRTRLSYLLVS